MGKEPRQRRVDRAQSLRASKEREARVAATLKARLEEQFSDEGAFAPAAAEILPDRAPPLNIPEMSFAAEEAAVAETMPLSDEPNLAALAHEINARLISAARNEEISANHRLTAALRLVEAEAACKAAKLNWKRWSEHHIKQSKRTVYQLLAIGKSPDPKAALEQQRAKNAFYNKELRERKRLTGPATTTAADRGIGGTGESPEPAAASAEARRYYVTVESLLADYAQLPPAEQREFLARAPRPEERAA